MCTCRASRKRAPVPSLRPRRPGVVAEDVSCVKTGVCAALQENVPPKFVCVLKFVLKCGKIHFLVCSSVSFNRCVDCRDCHRCQDTQEGSLSSPLLQPPVCSSVLLLWPFQDVTCGLAVWLVSLSIRRWTFSYALVCP